ncbi:MAG: hypothetical protein RL095_2211 [Verrucomicrobiota bacterium]
MRIAFFNAKAYDRDFFSRADAAGRHQLVFLEAHLDASTLPLAAGAEAVCIFVNDKLDAPLCRGLAALGVRFVALRCAGFNNVDLEAADAAGLKVVRVPAYSPHAVAEHTIGLLLCANRRIHRAHNRVREGNFELKGLMGFDLHGKTAGVIGTGRIGALVAGLLQSFGCRVLAHDLQEDAELLRRGVEYAPLDRLYRDCDIISLHCPLLPATHHLIDATALAKMKKGVTLVNTSRGGLIDTQAAIEAIKNEKIGLLAIDVYEEESNLFFENLSEQIIRDDLFARLQSFPNVLITGHQAYFTDTALGQIAATTLANLEELAASGSCPNEVHSTRHLAKRV